MTAATNLKRRGAVYYARRRVPNDLLKHYGGQSELAISLKIKSLTEAKRRANEQWARWTEFQSLRIAAPVEPSRTIETNAALADEFAARWLADHIAADEESRRLGESDAQREAREEAVNWVWEEWREALAVGCQGSPNFQQLWSSKIPHPRLINRSS